MNFKYAWKKLLVISMSIIVISGCACDSNCQASVKDSNERKEAMKQEIEACKGSGGIPIRDIKYTENMVDCKFNKGLSNDF